MRARLVIPESNYRRLAELVRSARTRPGDRPYLASLGQELDRSRVLPPAKVPRNVVTMHSCVRVRDMDSDEVSTYTLVYPAEADIDAGMLSVLAPLGTALLGTRAGQVIRWRVPAGICTLRVEEVLYQPEGGGERRVSGDQGDIVPWDTEET